MDGCDVADDARFQMAFIIMAIFTRVTNYLTFFSPLNSVEDTSDTSVAHNRNAAARTVISGMTSRPMRETFKPISD